MNKKFFNRLVFILIVVFMMILTNYTFSFAAIPTTATINKGFANDTSVSNIGNKLTGALKIVGVFVFVGVTMYIGIRYMLGSVEEKAEYKKTMMPYFVGAVLILATTQFINFIYKLIN